MNEIKTDQKQRIKYPFSNHIIFAMVMDDPNLCKELIERILPDRKVKEVRIKEEVASIMTLEEEFMRRTDYLLHKGREEGVQQGEARLNGLYLKLRDEGRIDDIFKAAEDKEYRDALFQEFGI